MNNIRKTIEQNKTIWVNFFVNSTFNHPCGKILDMSHPEALEPAFQAIMTQLQIKLAEERVRISTPNALRQDAHRSYFNNFHANLPGGVYRRMYDNSEQYAKVLGTMRLKGVLKGNTLREFHAEIDRIIEEEDISVDEIVRLQEEKLKCLSGRVIARDDSDMIRYNELHLELLRLTLPVFAQLLLAGYSDYPDLTA